MFGLLSVETNYKKLGGDPTIQLKLKLNDLVIKGAKKKILNKKEAKYFVSL